MFCGNTIENLCVSMLNSFQFNFELKKMNSSSNADSFHCALLLENLKENDELG